MLQLNFNPILVLFRLVTRKDYQKRHKFQSYISLIQIRIDKTGGHDRERDFNPILVLFRLNCMSTVELLKLYFNPILVLFRSFNLHYAIQGCGNFNPILVLFRYAYTSLVQLVLNKFQSYISLIQIFF